MVALCEFLSSPGPILDVRAPAEYAHGHIPGALSLPLFSDDERAIVGTRYKQEGKERAIELGIKLVGPKLSGMLEEAKHLIGEGKQCRLYCWRGGMRSGFMSWFLNFCALRAITLTHGYKTWRRAVLQQFQEPYPLHVVGGFTGSGKTALLEQLGQSGHQVIDLEAFAHHRGSAFGLAPGAVQPTTEQFENDVAYALLQLDQARPIWVEDESRTIGTASIPKEFFERMKSAPLYFIEVPLKNRVDHILEVYGSFPEEYLASCTQKLAKRLGPGRTEKVCALIREKDLKGAIADLLEYYDENYAFALARYSRPIKRLGASEFLNQWGC